MLQTLNNKIYLDTIKTLKIVFSQTERSFYDFQTLIYFVSHKVQIASSYLRNLPNILARKS